MPKKSASKQPKYHLKANGEFVIENYNFSKPFANFFPGIAGKYGIPMWVFYVNRAQCVCSFGTKDKDHAIMEFFPANKAWQMVSSTGFRTFIKLNFGKKPVFYEPFHNGFNNLGFSITNRMRISSSGLIIEEENSSLGLSIKVEYFNIPNDSYSGLARITTVKNTTGKAKELEIIDGIPQIVPFGTNNFFLKKMGRTIEAWMQVENLNKDVPFYKLAVDPIDRPEVIHIKEGNFYLGFTSASGKTKIIKPITDPDNVFSPVTDLSLPYRFSQCSKFSVPKNELTTSKSPCAFSYLNTPLKPREEKSIFSITGYMRNRETLNNNISRLTAPGYLEKKRAENLEVIHSLQEDVATSSSSREFDLYTKQNYLDNIMRGGYPEVLTSKNKRSVFYLYSRKHGDLERDYNKFHIEATYLSQGNGNYRDINQNRRCDTWFNPQIKENNLVEFFNLIQSDGFNPLIIKGSSFILNDPTDLKNLLKRILEEKSIATLNSFMRKPFTPGDLILFIEDKKIKLDISYDEFLAVILPECKKISQAEHGEGFWTDHWSYNLDLLDSYLALYPETEKELIFDKRIFHFFDNAECVKPRAEKYLLRDGIPKQLHSVALDNAKRDLIKSRQHNAHVVRSDYGQGEIYSTTLLNKLLCLLANKFASLDPDGVGIEMESDKPNWYDALNGLPALFGSSACETFELKRLIEITLSAINRGQVLKAAINEEIQHFLLQLNSACLEFFSSNSENRDFIFWDKTHTAKEDYRHKTRFGFKGCEIEVESGYLVEILNNTLKKVDTGIEKALDKKTGAYFSYFINQVTEFETLNPIHIRPTKFIQKKVPIFLEAQMHALRLAKNSSEAQKIYKATKSSLLFDKILKMYKVTAPLKDMPEEIGRCRVFTPGWLENESIWLHMEYKYILEVLKRGLYKEFYADFKNVLIPFQKPSRYGRSILENSSFLVSSAFSDKKLHGNGFVARLSGSTAEFIQIWLTMNTGNNPFFLNESNELNLKFTPAIAGWLFNKKGNYSFNFLSTIKVTYHNPRKKDTFGKNRVVIKKICFSDALGETVELNKDTIPSPFSEQIRSRQVESIDIFLG